MNQQLKYQRKLFSNFFLSKMGILCCSSYILQGARGQITSCVTTSTAFLRCMLAFHISMVNNSEYFLLWKYLKVELLNRVERLISGAFYPRSQAASWGGSQTRQRDRGERGHRDPISDSPAVVWVAAGNKALTVCPLPILVLLGKIKKKKSSFLWESLYNKTTLGHSQVRGEEKRASV